MNGIGTPLHQQAIVDCKRTTVSSAVGSPFLTLGHLQHKQLNRTISGIASVPHQKMKSAAPKEVGVSVLTPPEYTTTVMGSVHALSGHTELCARSVLAVLRSV